MDKTYIIRYHKKYKVLVSKDSFFSVLQTLSLVNPDAEIFLVLKGDKSQEIAQNLGFEGGFWFMFDTVDDLQYFVLFCHLTLDKGKSELSSGSDAIKVKHLIEVCGGDKAVGLLKRDKAKNYIDVVYSSWFKANKDEIISKASVVNALSEVNSQFFNI